MISFPNAKINIGLHILNKREDGFHELETVFYPVRLCDALELIQAPTLSFTSSGLDIPGGAVEDNLCMRAYKLVRSEFDIPPVNIHLHKRIPMGAGLGGGSSDAGFLIRMLNEKFELGMSRARMKELAAKLGSDCPFFIDNKTSLARGRGEVLSLFDIDLSSCFLVLVMPPVHVPTAEAFKGLSLRRHECSLPELLQQPLSTWKSAVRNDFEESVFGRYPVIGEIKKELYDSGAIYASMSGSGASVYGIFSTAVRLENLELDHKVYYAV